MHTTSLFSSQDDVPSPVGFFTWDVPRNLVFGDSVFAQIYEIAPEEIAEGICVERILELVLLEDRGQLAEQIHAVLLGNEPAPLHYRIRSASTTIKSLTSIGTCFRDAEGVPSYYSGAIILNIDSKDQVHDPLMLYIETALEIARDQGRELTSRHLSSALGSLGRYSK
ncbi:PAS domain-containing protein [Rhizobium sp. RM]|uniref:PAS domain-containing protein n=1 Tax=Rhizobium sp. RM TaxID=2748079 RepID=UPI00110D54C1|nr:PAS domain-containing protein [Rhizobium sp. RM]NWJ27536.1 PAS domain-containing protein [Rhizobium sp. RM]TMV20002.1 PAS domain-containing protein [Rhizobium sp. Td3]